MSIPTTEDNISIQFDKKYTIVYQTGEVVSGKATFIHDGKIALKLKNVTIELAGGIVYYSGARGPPRAKSADIHVVSFLSEKQIACAAENEGSFLLEPGNYTWPFSFPLADTLPSTLDETRYHGPRVRYIVRVHLIRSEWYKKNIQKVSPIVIQYRPLPILPVDCRDENQNRKNIHLQVVLPGNVVVAGEKLSFNVNLHNPTRIKITRISMNLIQHQELGPAGKDDVVLLKKDLNGIDNFEGEHFQNTFNVQLPEKMVPTYLCIPPQWSSQKPLVISYAMHLEAHVQGLSSNVSLRLPLTVTNIKQKKHNADPLPPQYEKVFLV